MHVWDWVILGAAIVFAVGSVFWLDKLRSDSEDSTAELFAKDGE